jgi:hypothetical protein
MVADDVDDTDLKLEIFVCHTNLLKGCGCEGTGQVVKGCQQVSPGFFDPTSFSSFNFAFISEEVDLKERFPDFEELVTPR